MSPFSLHISDLTHDRKTTRMLDYFLKILNILNRLLSYSAVIVSERLMFVIRI